MKMLDVQFCGWGQNWQLGTLAHAGRSLLFEYSAEARQRGVELSPVLMPLRQAAYQGFPATQDSLPGLIADALPDGWGRRLMDSCFQKAERPLADVSPLDRLAFVHDRAMGALVFTPSDVLSQNSQHRELLELAEGARTILAGRAAATLEQLAFAGGSPNGANPKVLVQYDPIADSVSTDRAAPGAAWLVKFQGQGETKEVCAIETTYSVLARHCGLDMPATRHFELSKSLAAFGVARFDRERGMRVPVLSLAALLDHDFRRPSSDYEVLLKATRTLTKDEREVRKAFERCVFNVIFNNRDDHTKNFAYVMNDLMQWKLAPCFDLTFSTGPGGEHQMAVLGEGRAPSLKHLLALASACDVPSAWARQAVERITEVAGTFGKQAQDLNITNTAVKRIADAIEDNRKRML